MTYFPDSTWIVMEAKTKSTQSDLVCIGYNYDKKKVLYFATTRGDKSTEVGVPYEARRPD